MSMENSSDTIGNRTRELKACRAVPQLNAPPRGLEIKEANTNDGKYSVINHSFWIPYTGGYGNCQQIGTSYSTHKPRALPLNLTVRCGELQGDQRSRVVLRKF